MCTRMCTFWVWGGRDKSHYVAQFDLKLTNFLFDSASQKAMTPFLPYKLGIFSYYIYLFFGGHT